LGAFRPQILLTPQERRLRRRSWGVIFGCFIKIAQQFL
jgi:hypothetical protein